MKISITMLLVLTMSGLVACNDKSESTSAADTKQIANIASTSITPTLVPNLAATQVSTTPKVMSNSINAKPELAEAGPLKPLLLKACACKTPECGSKMLDELLVTVKSKNEVSRLNKTISTLSNCVMAAGIDKNEFITKMRQLRR